MHDLVPARLADRVAWGAVTLAAGGLVYALALYWGANPGHADRFLILVGAGYAAVALAPSWMHISATPRPVIGLPLALVGWIAFAAGTFLLVQAGPRTILLWWLAGGLALAALGVGLARAGVGRVRAALFPLLFPLFALPVPLRVLNPLQDVLQDVTTGLSFRALSLAGMEVERSEYVLSLPGGKLRVEEACSGVRSLTALTAIAAFVAFWRGFGPGRGGLLVGLSVPIVGLVNALRVVLSGFIQEWAGAEYIRDAWHESLGFAMVFVGLGLILKLAGWLTPTPDGSDAGTAVATLSPPPSRGRVRVGGDSPPGGGSDSGSLSIDRGESPPTLTLPREGGGDKAQSHPCPSPVHEGHSRGQYAAAAIGVFGVGLAAWGVLGGRTTTAAAEESAPLADIARELPGGWRGTDLPVPPVVADLLAPDVAVYRVYRNNVGDDVFVWAFYWRTGAAIKGYHHPDVCWGNKGFASASKWFEPVAPNVPATAREFAQPPDPTGVRKRQPGDSQVVLYWTQEGPHVWTDEDERAAANDMLSSSWSGHQWVGDLIGAGGRAAGPRLQAVVIVPAVGPRARKDGAAVARGLAGELYRVCPWAVP